MNPLLENQLLTTRRQFFGRTAKKLPAGGEKLVFEERVHGDEMGLRRRLMSDIGQT